MFRHIVLLRFNDSSTVEQHRAVVEGLRGLPAVIPEIRNYDVHLDAGLSTDNAHVSAVADFDGEAAWRTYSTHPEHLAVIAEHITPILASACRTQFSFRP